MGKQIRTSISPSVSTVGLVVVGNMGESKGGFRSGTGQARKESEKTTTNKKRGGGVATRLTF